MTFYFYGECFLCEDSSYWLKVAFPKYSSSHAHIILRQIQVSDA